MGLNHLLRLVGAYQGAIFYKMEAGMGDVVFAPMYEVLKRRGVRFEFFHMVQNLALSDAYEHVERIELDRQVSLKDGAASYEPLISVKGLPCWPNQPLWDQIEDGDVLREAHYDYEDRASDWPVAERVVLRRGHEFDVALLGASIGEFPYIARELIANKRGFRPWRCRCGMALIDWRWGGVTQTRSRRRMPTHCRAGRTCRMWRCARRGCRGRGQRTSRIIVGRC